MSPSPSPNPSPNPSELESDSLASHRNRRNVSVRQEQHGSSSNTSRDYMGSVQKENVSLQKEIRGDEPIEQESDQASNWSFLFLDGNLLRQYVPTFEQLQHIFREWATVLTPSRLKVATVIRDTCLEERVSFTDQDWMSSIALFEHLTARSRECENNSSSAGDLCNVWNGMAMDPLVLRSSIPSAHQLECISFEWKRYFSTERWGLLVRTLDLCKEEKRPLTMPLWQVTTSILERFMKTSIAPQSDMMQDYASFNLSVEEATKTHCVPLIIK